MGFGLGDEDLTARLTEEQLASVSKKLDSIKLEMLRLRVSLLPEEGLTSEERKELEEALKEFDEGKSVPLSKLRNSR